MWIVAKSGFFSIVENKDADHTYMVRARVGSDLERLLKITGMTREIFVTPSADYGYRIVVDIAGLQCVMAALAIDVDYPNFKNAIDATTSMIARRSIIHRVYDVLSGLRVIDIKRKAVLNGAKTCDDLDRNHFPGLKADGTIRTADDAPSIFDMEQYRG
jgi:hypothetical protein